MFISQQYVHNDHQMTNTVIKQDNKTNTSRTANKFESWFWIRKSFRAKPEAQLVSYLPEDEKREKGKQYNKNRNLYHLNHYLQPVHHSKLVYLFIIVTGLCWTKIKQRKV